MWNITKRCWFFFRLNLPCRLAIAVEALATSLRPMPGQNNTIQLITDRVIVSAYCPSSDAAQGFRADVSNNEFLIGEDDTLTVGEFISVIYRKFQTVLSSGRTRFGRVFKRIFWLSNFYLLMIFKPWTQSYMPSARIQPQINTLAHSGCLLSIISVGHLKVIICCTEFSTYLFPASP